MKRNCFLYFAFCLFGVLYSGMPAPTLGQETTELAVVPYQPLWMIIDSESLPEGFECSASFRIAAGGKDLPPPDLKVHIEAGESKVPLPVSETGEFELPENRKWAEANGRLVTNQPKGSLRMICGIEISGNWGLKPGNLKYQDVMVLLKLCFDRLKGASLLTGVKFEESSLHLEYTVSDPKSDNRKITIHSENEKLVYEADDDGLIILPFDTSLFNQNPKIDVPDGTASFHFKFGEE